MILHDLHNRLSFSRALSPVSVADNTAQVTQIFDMQGYSGLELAMMLGSLADADATFAVTGTHGDESDLSDGVALTNDDLLGTLAGASFTFADDNLVKSIGYRGGVKRYVRFTITPSNNASAALLSAIFIGVPKFRGYVG